MGRFTLDTLGQAVRARLLLEAECRNYLCRHRWPVDLDHVIANVGADHRLAPVRGVRHFSERMRCPNCGWVGVTIYKMAVMRQTPLIESLFMSIEEWDQKNVQMQTLIARTGHLEVGWAAYRGAVAAYPGRRIQLLDNRRVIADSTLTVLDGGKVPWRQQ